MSPQEIVKRLCDTPKGITAERVKKAQALAGRSNVPWDVVLAAMSEANRGAVESVQKPTADDRIPGRPEAEVASA